MAHIRVTQADIDNGEEKSSYRCAVALAIRRQFNIPIWRSGVGVSGGMAYLYATADSPELRAVLPDSACTFINMFDGGMPVEPFEFDVEFTDEVTRTHHSAHHRSH